MRSFAPLVCCLLLVVAVAGTAAGQPKPGYDPTSTHIFPSGGRRGTTFAARVGTECAPPLTRLHLLGEGVAAPDRLERYATFRGEPSPRRLPTEIPITYPREWDSEITIADDAPLGVVFWRLSCAQGTPSRPFVIGDLPEWIETEPNSRIGRAEAVSLPVTVNGQINGERDVDYFRFAAGAGEVVSCELLARRLGSGLDPVVTVLDAAGDPVRVDEAQLGDDRVFVLRAPRAGEYLLRIANVSWRGSAACVYRINLTKKPFLIDVFPAAGRAGSSKEVEFQIVDGSGATAVRERVITFPEAPRGQWTYRHDEMSGDLDMFISDAPCIVENEGNNSHAEAQTLPTPVHVQARFLETSDEDWFRFPADKGRNYALRCRANRPASDCLPELALVNAEGMVLRTAASVDMPDRIARIDWPAPTRAHVFVRVRHLRRGVAAGPGFGYHLSVEPARPDFELSLDSDNLNVTQGATAEVNVSIRRHGGFCSPVRLQLLGLPPNVMTENSTIAAKQDSAKLKVIVGNDVPSASYPLRLVGRAIQEGDQTERVAAAPHLGLDSEGVSIGPSKLDVLNLTVRHKPLFRLYCSEAYEYAHRGTIYPYRMAIERLDGFDGEVVVQRGDRQNRDMDGIEFITTAVAAGESEFMMPIYLPETMHINVQSQSQLYTQAHAVFTDQHSLLQSVLVLAEKRNMIRTLPPVVQLRTADEDLRAMPGQTVACRLKLERTSNFLGPMTVSLKDTAGGRVDAEPVVVPAGGRESTIDLRVPADAAVGRLPIRFRATGFLDGATEVVSEATCELVVAAVAQ